MTTNQTADKQPILIVGLPRSGTTWIGKVFASTRSSSYIFEPDNEGLSPLAWLCKNDLHRFPYLMANDEAGGYQQLWQTVLAGRTWRYVSNEALGIIFRIRAPELEAFVGEKTGLRYVDRSIRRVGRGNRVKPYLVENHPLIALLTRELLDLDKTRVQSHRIVVKSVHGVLSLDWISHHFPFKVVLVLRNPYSLYASYKRLKMPDGFRNLLFQESLQRDFGEFLPSLRQGCTPERADTLAFQIALMYKVVERQIAAHPEWMLLSHDRLCITPHEGYRRTFEDLDLHWSDRTDEQIDALNKKGEGFKPRRIAKVQPTKWKGELSAEERQAIDRWTSIFELGSFFREYVNVER